MARLSEAEYAMQVDFARHMEPHLDAAYQALLDAHDRAEAVEARVREYCARQITETNPALIALVATAISGEAFALAQPDHGKTFGWVDDHRERLALAATRAIGRAMQGEAAAIRAGMEGRP